MRTLIMEAACPQKFLEKGCENTNPRAVCRSIYIGVYTNQPTIEELQINQVKKQETKQETTTTKDTHMCVRERTDLAVKFKIATQSPGVKTGLSSLATKIISD